MTKITPKRLIIDIDQPLHAKIKAIASKKGQSIKDLITHLIVKEIIRIEYKNNVDSNI